METNKQFRAVAYGNALGTQDLLSNPVGSSQEASDILKEHFKRYPTALGKVEKWNPKTLQWETYINERQVL